MRRAAYASAASVLLLLSTARADDVFTDGQLTVEWTHVGNDYTGTFTLGDQKFPAKAVGTPTGIEGSFQANGSAFPFTASRTGETITLVTGGKTYTLKPKAAAPVNPLGQGAAPVVSKPANLKPADAPAAPAGYTVINHTDAGQALAGAKPDAKTVREALMASYADLSKYFDEAPTIGGAYEDVKDHRSGSALFVARLKGKPVRGVMSTMLTDKGAEVAVLYASADAGPDEWRKLTAAPTQQQGGAPPAQQQGGAPGADAGVATSLKTYEFPDGTGSIGIAEGWKTTAQSGLDRVLIDGPADTHVVLGGSFYIITPDSQMIATQRQLEAQSRQMGLRPPPPLQMLVAPFAEPADALQAIAPQLSAMSVRNGGFALRIDQILSSKPAQPMMQNSKAAALEYLVTRNDHGRVYQVHNMARVECSPVGQGAWTMYMNEISAPVNDFDKQKPVMLAMIQSYKENPQGIQRVSAQRQQQQQQNFQNMQDANAAQKANFEGLQQAHRTQMAGFEDHNRQWSADQNRTSRSNDDYVEMIRGYRTVVDTQTGEKASADYGNVDNIVNNLNERDPGRYQQIPLRDENHPNP